MNHRKNRMIILYIALAVSAALLIFALCLITMSETISAIPAPGEGALPNDEAPFAAEVEPPSGTVAIKNLGFANSRYIRIVPGGTYKIDVAASPSDANETIYWSSSAPSVARVGQDGLVSALETGETVIYAENYTGKIHTQAIVQVMKIPDKILNVPYISQLRDFPNGCESCSTVMALNYAGIDITTNDFIEKYLDMKPLPAVDKNGVYSGYSPWDYFLGDPREASGLCCYAPAIVKALNKFVDGEEYEIKEMYKVPLETLCRDYISKNIPVIIWGTMYMLEPYDMNWSWQVTDGKDGERFTWVAPIHCLLMIGYDNDNYYFNDPVSGKGIAYSKDDTEKAYAGLYSQAIAIIPRVSPDAKS